MSGQADGKVVVITSLAQKVQAMQQTAKPAKAKVRCELSQDKEEAAISFNILEFVRAIGPSSTNTTEGAYMQLPNSEMVADVPGLGKVTFIVDGGFWLKARVQVTDPTPADSKVA